MQQGPTEEVGTEDGADAAEAGVDFLIQGAGRLEAEEVE